MPDPTGEIINCIIKVHNAHGPGFREYIYRNSMFIELHKRGLSTTREETIPIYYEGEVVGSHRLDLWLNREVVLELKTVEELNKDHYAQLRSYMKASHTSIGLLVNFAKDKADWRRIDMEF